MTKLVPYGPDRKKVGDVIAALVAETLVDGERPRWLDDQSGPEPQDVIAFSNGLIDAREYCAGKVNLIRSTPAWFSAAACPYAFDPEGKCPQWLKFLSEVFEGDEESIRLLQEWFGYLLVPDNRLESFMLMYGKPGSGKSTVQTVLTEMLGRGQVAVSSFRKLAGRFGLHPLEGKLAIVLTDAHIDKSTDTKAALEVLKSITGSDPQSVDRKNINELPFVHLTARFTISVNELPELPDHSGALQKRMLLLYFGRSFVGEEDETLKDRLRTEAPGVAVWALKGLRRLREERRFTVPARTKAAREKFKLLVSPINCFVEECCELSPKYSVPKKDLCRAWELWCEDHDEIFLGAACLGKSLLNANPGVTPGRRSVDGKQIGVYEGVQLKGDPLAPCS